MQRWSAVFDEIKGGNGKLTPELYKEAKEFGYPDKVIQDMTGVKFLVRGILKEAKKAAELVAKGKLAHIPATYKMVDTCAGEFNAETPYFYSGYNADNEAADFLAMKGKKSLKGKKGTIIVLGSGPIRIGQEINWITRLFSVYGRLKNWAMMLLQ